MMTYIGMKTCPVCDGEGRLEYEVPVVDHYHHGGYLDTEMGDCDRCGGTGEVEDWEDEE
jgi:RecJ-like exonuclease